MEIERDKRLCWLCRHFEFDGGEPGYSERTPGRCASIGCGLNIWGLKEAGFPIRGKRPRRITISNEPDFRQAIYLARDCEDFELDEVAAEEIAAL